MIKFIIEILLLIAGAIAGLFGIFGNTYDNDNKKITINGIRTLAVIAVVLVLSLISKFAEYQEKKEEEATSIANADSTKQAQLNQYKIQINKLERITKNLEVQTVKQDTLNSKANTISNNQSKLNIKYQNLITASKELLNNQSGANSFCYVSPVPIADYAIRLQLAHIGKYNLHNLRVEIENLDYYDKNYLPKILPKRMSTKNTDVEVLIKTTNLEIGELTVNETKVLGFEIRFPQKTHFTYRLTFFATNAKWRQIFKMRMVRNSATTGLRTFASQVYKIDEKKKNWKGKLLHEIIGEGFPKDANGKIDWENPD